MSFGDLFGTPFDEATSVVILGSVWDCAINGKPYRLDRDSDAFKQGLQTIAAIREQADNSQEPGEASISREELWRAGQASWHKGAGQRFRDKPESDPERFWNSRGVNVWHKDQLSLLHNTSTTTSQTGTGDALISVNGYLYHSSTTHVERSNDAGVTWTAITGISGTVTGMTTDGYRLWVITTAGSYKGDTTGTALSATGWTLPAAFVGQPDHIAFVNNRLLIANKNLIAEVNGSGTVTVLNPNETETGLVWASITDGTSAIYAAANSGTRARIYSLRPPTDALDGALGVPIPATPWLPTDELINCIYEYLGLICIGTNYGIRVAQKISDYTGREILSVGPLTYVGVPYVGQPVRTMYGEGQYVYFNWDNFDSTHTGIGRANLGQATDNLTYAYASDLMYVGQGTVSGIASVGTKKYFTVDGHGVMKELDTYCPDGWLDSGIVRYSLIDLKVAQRVELRHDSLAGSVGVSLCADGASALDLGTNSLANSVAPAITFSAKQTPGYNFNVITRMTPSADALGSPVIQHVELRSSVVPSRGDTFLLPILLDDSDPQFGDRDVFGAFQELRQLARQQHTSVIQYKALVVDGIVTDYQWSPTNETRDGRFWNGTLTLKLMAPAS